MRTLSYFQFKNNLLNGKYDIMSKWRRLQERILAAIHGSLWVNIIQVDSRAIKWLPNGHTTLLQNLINVNDVDSTSQQRRVPSG